MAGRRQKRFAQLDLQLEGILDAMIMASQEPDPERREEKLAVVERAFGAYHKEHMAILARPTLRALPGGAVAFAALAAAGSWIRQHPQVTVGTVVTAAAAVVGLLLLAPWRSQIEQGPPVSAPTATAPPSSDAPSPSPSEAAPSSPPPSSSTPSESPAPSVVPTLSQGPTPPASWETPGAGPGSTAPDEPSESQPGPGDGTDPEVPPDDDEDDDDQMEDPVPPGPDRCLVDVDLPMLDIRVGDLLCL